MSKDLIRYDLLVQEALKGVVRKVLANAVREGLPGDHHFYVSFKTLYPGVKISQRLREKHPNDMTIVLQHQFWDLAVSETGFEVGLSFSGVPEKLSIPFEAVTGFFDPSVQFGLKFETDDSSGDAEETGRPATPGAGSEPAVVPSPTKLPTPAQKKAPAARPVAVDKSEAPRAESANSKDSKAEPAEKPAEKPAKTDKGGKAEKPAAPQTAGAEVVSLDAFRKKP